MHFTGVEKRYVGIFFYVFFNCKKGGNHLKEQPKIIFANKIDTKVFDKEFYLKLLKHIAELKQNQTKNN